MLYELKNLRKASGFTQASMAEKLGVPLGTYRNWEQGIYAPQDISLIKQIADILHVSMERCLDTMPLSLEHLMTD